jgi:hypothetical protein
MTAVSRSSFRSLWWFALLLVVLLGCTDTGKLSADKAGQHVEYLSGVVKGDVEEVRRGLPEGAKQVASAFHDDEDPAKDPELAKQALQIARGTVQDLRVAKSSFFALATADGTVIRNDRDVDMMAGKNLLAAFPKLKAALDGKYVETTGSMHEARGVEGKPDGQWVAGTSVTTSAGPRVLFVTGWAWSTYAGRLEAALRTKILDTEKAGKEPLYYVFVVAGSQAFGSRTSPPVDAEAIQKLDPIGLVHGPDTVTRQIEITGRTFGLGLKRVPELGDDVAIAVLRSET